MWSEESSCNVRHEHRRAIPGVAADMSGDVGAVIVL